MGIQLDWKVVADQTQQRDHEDPESKNRRRRRRFQLIMIAVIVGLVVCAVGAFVFWRVRTVDQREKDNLAAAVEAEFAAIRIGSTGAFMNIQRSSSDPWINSQRAVFAEYQTLKAEGRLSPDTEVVDVVIDEERGRAVIEEYIDGQPYRQVWFYWNYTPSGEDDSQAGWRHVPPDITFWGEEASIENEHSSVTYQELDEDIAETLAPNLESWWVSGCQWLACSTPPQNVELVIDPEAGLRVAWEPDNLGWRLRMISPYLAGRVPVADAMPSLLEQEVTGAVAERLIDHASGGRLQFAFANASIGFDTTWLKFQLRDWLAAKFRGEASLFLDSAVAVFGEGVPAYIANNVSDGQQINQLARGLDPNASTLTDIDVRLLNQLNWGAFFEWRLQLERERLQNNDLDNFFALYEGGNTNPSANARAVDAAYASSPVDVLNSVTLTYDVEGRLNAQITAGSNQLLFVWTGDTFIRVN